MDVRLKLEQESAPFVMRASLSLISKSHTLRCDAKQAEIRFSEYDLFITNVDHLYLGDYLPKAFIKGAQPKYIEALEPEGVPVISTICIQQLAIHKELCRYITQEDYDALEEERQPRIGDVLVTVDGGTSIGKPVYFDIDEDFAVDSHVAILRPVGLDPKLLVYLLASPLGQIQFQQAESGASGQTGVTEDDIRRFRFPVIDKTLIAPLVTNFDNERSAVATMEKELKRKVNNAWTTFTTTIISNTKTKERQG
jgi:restriction endonuclease S subunit